jgi:hypothetical protein
LSNAKTISLARAMQRVGVVTAKNGKRVFCKPLPSSFATYSSPRRDQLCPCLRQRAAKTSMPSGVSAAPLGNKLNAVEPFSPAWKLCICATAKTLGLESQTVLSHSELLGIWR